MRPLRGGDQGPDGLNHTGKAAALFVNASVALMSFMIVYGPFRVNFVCEHRATDLCDTFRGLSEEY